MANRARTSSPLRKRLERLSAGRRRRRNPNRSGPVAAAEVDGSVLRVVQAVPRGGRLDLTRIAVETLEFPPTADRDNPEVVGRAVRQALDRARIKLGPVVMGVPRADVVLRTLSLPTIDDPGQLAAMIHLQVGKDLPFRPDEAVIDFQILPAPQPASPTPPSAGNDRPEESATAAPKTEVLVGIIQRGVAEFYRKMATAAGLNLTALGLLPHANARSVQACRVAEGDEGVAIVTLRPDEVGIDVVAQNALLFSRGAMVKPRADAADNTSVSAAAADKDPPEARASSPESDRTSPLVETAIIEVVRSLHSYAAIETRHPVAKLVVAGATGHETEVVEDLSTRLNLPCSMLDVVGRLHLPEDAALHSPGALAGIGLILGASDPEGIPFDFLNPKRPARPRNPRRTAMLVGGAVAVGLLVLAVGARTFLVGKRLALQANLQAELVEAKKKRPIYRQMRQQLVTVQDWLREGHNWLEHYAYLSAVLPPSEDVYITALAVGGQGNIRLSVQARSGAVLAKLDQQLRAAGYDVKPIAIHPGSDKFGYEFRSTVEMTVPAKLKVDLSKVRPPTRPADDASLDPVRRGKGGSS